MPKLVLTRQRDQVIKIGDDIAVTIVDIRGDKVKVMIEAPETVPVHRLEVYEEIQREKAAKGKAAEAMRPGRSIQQAATKGVLRGGV